MGELCSHCTSHALLRAADGCVEAAVTSSEPTNCRCSQPVRSGLIPSKRLLRLLANDAELRAPAVKKGWGEAARGGLGRVGEGEVGTATAADGAEVGEGVADDAAADVGVASCAACCSETALDAAEEASSCCGCRSLSPAPCPPAASPLSRSLCAVSAALSALSARRSTWKVERDGGGFSGEWKG